MKYKRTPFLILGGNLLLMLLIYMPAVVGTMRNLEILAPALWNLLLIVVDLIVAIIVSIIPATRKYAPWWWVGFASVVLLSFPACLAAMSLSTAIHQP